MGHMSAMGMATATDIRTGIEWHLKYNHYPPVPSSMVEPAIRAINKIRCNDVHSRVRLPKGVRHRVHGSVIPAWILVEELHLEPWIEEIE